jgi:TonB family protein
MASRAARLFATAVLSVLCAATVAAQPPRVRVGGDIERPQKLVHVDPVYPEEAKANNITGMVIVEALLATDGTVSDVKIIRSVHPLLDTAASEAVRQWVFSQTFVGGEAAELVMTVNVTFVREATAPSPGPPPPPPPPPPSIRH